MTVVPLPVHGHWAWDARGEGRAARVSTHGEAGLVNLSLWRGDFCVGTVRLSPDEVSRLVSGLAEGLAGIARERPTAPEGAPAADAARLRELEQRLAALEARGHPAGHRSVESLLRELAGRWGAWRRRLSPPAR